MDIIWPILAVYAPLCIKYSTTTTQLYNTDACGITMIVKSHH